jgi:hypothetical protein
MHYIFGTQIKSNPPPPQRFKIPNSTRLSTNNCNSACQWGCYCLLQSRALHQAIPAAVHQPPGALLQAALLHRHSHPCPAARIPQVPGNNQPFAADFRLQHAHALPLAVAAILSFLAQLLGDYNECYKPPPGGLRLRHPVRRPARPAGPCLGHPTLRRPEFFPSVTIPITLTVWDG